MSNTLFQRFKLFTATMASSGGVGAPVWGAITGLLSNQTDLQNALNAKLDDTATTAEVDPSTNRNYVTDAELVVIGNTSNTNTGDETQSTIVTKLALHSGTVNIDFEISGDFLTTTVPALWVTASHKGKIKCEVFDDGIDHLEGEAALGNILASINNIIPGVSFDILVVSQHDTWGRYVIKYNEII
jgi:hypothetical protein